MRGNPLGITVMLNGKSIAFAALLLLPLARPSHAAMMTAQDLMSACSAGGQARATCDGYLMAIADFAQRRAAHRGGQAKVCMPAEVTVDQVRDAVLRIGERGRALRAPYGLGLVAVALRRTWPCGGGDDFRRPGDFQGPANFRGPGDFSGQGRFRPRGNAGDMLLDDE
jgi:hypothetical protein